jgi:hypothetical protein
MSFDRTRIPNRRWVYFDDGYKSEGITLSSEGVVFWAVFPDEEMFGGGSYRASFREFLRDVKRGNPRLSSIPPEILEEIRLILEGARG